MIAHLRIFSTTMSRKPFCADPGRGSDWAFCVTRSAVSDSAIPWTVPSCLTLQSHGLYPAGLLCPWDSPGKNTAVRCPFLLQGIFRTQWLNPCLLHCRRMLYHRARGWQTGLDSAEFPHCKGTEGRIFALVGENQGMGFFFFFFSLFATSQVKA